MDTKMQLYQQDCIEGMRERLEPGSVDVFVTSPPYNLGIDYNGYGVLPWDIKIW